MTYSSTPRPPTERPSSPAGEKLDLFAVGKPISPEAAQELSDGMIFAQPNSRLEQALEAHRRGDRKAFDEALK